MYGPHGGGGPGRPEDRGRCPLLRPGRAGGRRGQAAVLLMLDGRGQYRPACQCDRESGLVVKTGGRRERRVDDGEQDQQKGGDRTDDLPRQTGP